MEPNLPGTELINQLDPQLAEGLEVTVNEAKGQLERIKASFFDKSAEEKLKPRDLKKKERILECHDLRVNFHSKEQAAKILQRKFEVSRTESYRITQWEEYVFGAVGRHRRDSLRNILTEWLTKAIQLAAAEKPANVDAIIKATKVIGELNGLKKDDTELPDFENLMRDVTVIVADPSLIGLERHPNIEELIAKYSQRKSQGEPLSIDKWQDG